MYRYILRESCSQFDSLPLTSFTISPRHEKVEEKICALQRKKKALASDLLERPGEGGDVRAEQPSRRLGIDEVRSFFA